MEKRFVIFFVLSFAILLGYTLVMNTFFPPPPQEEVAQNDGDGDGKEDPADPDKDPDDPADPMNDPAEMGDPADPDKDPEMDPQEDPEDPAEEEDPAVAEMKAAKLGTTFLGSLDPASGYKLLVTLNNVGATVERLQVNSEDYKDLDDNYGYLGNLRLKTNNDGVLVAQVPPGSPAANAKPIKGAKTPGLQVDDIITSFNDTKIETALGFDAALKKTKPGDEITLTVKRGAATSTYSVKLQPKTMEIIKPEPSLVDGKPQHPDSFRLTLATQKTGKWAEVALDLKNKAWLIKDSSPSSVTYRYVLPAKELEALGIDQPIEVLKKYTLEKVTDTKEKKSDNASTGYHLGFDISFTNLGDKPVKFNYRLDGPNGLPVEGWWYNHKITSDFSGAGARDVVLDTVGLGYDIHRLPEIVSSKQKDLDFLLFDRNENSPEDCDVKYIGIDTQYFAAVMFPTPEKGKAGVPFAEGYAYVFDPVNDETEDLGRKFNASFALFSPTVELEPGKTSKQSFEIFAGPKTPEALSAAGLSALNYYGWFGGISRILLWILHFFHSFTFSYALSIILLTVMVRALMFPVGRKAALNAQKMQELAPEIKKISEKYKNDPMKQREAQAELFRSHNYNPLSGCWMMFLQLPVFLGLYRGLAVDIQLRGAPLIPGIEWANNLAAPDKLFYWGDWMFFSSETGWLGPYFNLLPLVTVCMFLVHQRMFTPPATDEQTKMQQQMMTYMMIFMGFMFFKVPSGLCLYFITSSLWGIAERKFFHGKTVSNVKAGHVPGKPSAGSGNDSKPEPTKGKETAESRKARQKKLAQKKKS